MKNKSFTLIETAIATLIMVMVLGSLVYSVSRMLKLYQSSRRQDIAVSAIQERLEYIKNDISNNINLTDPITFNATSLTPQPAGTVTAAQVATNLYNVTINVTWQETDGREISKEVTTTFYNK